MNRAEEAVANDSARLTRVLRARMSVELCIAHYALNAGDIIVVCQEDPFREGCQRGYDEGLDQVAQNSAKSGIATVTSITIQLRIIANMSKGWLTWA